mgnify:CR=1 FL=1
MTIRLRQAAGTCLLGLMGLAGACAPASAEVTLTLGSALPVKHVVVADGLMPFVEAVKQSSHGDVVWNLVPGGAMGNWVESFEALRNGGLDGASVVDINVASDLPLANVVSNLAMVGEDPRVMAAAVNELTLVKSPALLQDWLEEGVRPLSALSLAPFYLMCTSEVTSLDQVKGKRIRADGAYGLWVTAMGATPVNIQSVELFEAMQRGQVDCAIAAGAWLRSFSLFDVVKSMVNLRLGLFFGAWALAMNEDRWESLTPEQREANRSNLAGITRRCVEAYIKEDAAVMAEATGKGVAVTKPSQDMLDLLAAHRKKEVERVLAQASERGVPGAEPLVNDFLALVEKWKKIVAETGDDYDAYQTALEREIFSKVGA